MKKLHKLDATHIDRIQHLWGIEANKFGEAADYAAPAFCHAKSLQGEENGSYYGVLNTGDGCLMLAHVNQVMLPGDHHMTLRCGPLMTCPELQFERNVAWVQNRFMTAYTAMVKGVMLLAHELNLDQVRIHSPKEVHPHFWNGVLVLFRTEDITVNDVVLHEIEMQGNWAVIFDKSGHDEAHQ